jgi:hypothetical protein
VQSSSAFSPRTTRDPRGLRLSRENPCIKKQYEEFLQQPLSPTAYGLLRRHDVKRWKSA